MSCSPKITWWPKGDWVPPVHRVPGGLKGLSPTSPQGTWGAKSTESRQCPGYLGGKKYWVPMVHRVPGAWKNWVPPVHTVPGSQKDWVPPVLRVHGGPKGLSPASPQGTRSQKDWYLEDWYSDDLCLVASLCDSHERCFFVWVRQRACVCSSAERVNSVILLSSNLYTRTWLTMASSGTCTAVHAVNFWCSCGNIIRFFSPLAAAVLSTTTRTAAVKG